MLSYIQSFIRSIFMGEVNNEDDNDKENFLAEQLLDLELLKEAENATQEYTSDLVELPRNTVCFQRTGVITYHGETYVLIDGTLYFDLTHYTYNLNENDTIRYLGYKDKNESIIVVRILENLGVSWGADEEIDENDFDIIEHVLIGEVRQRENRFVYIKDSDLKFNLDKVEGTFIPIKGDWMEMKCKVQQDDKKLSDISMEQVLEVMSFNPLRTIVRHAVLTEWNGNFGILDGKIYINKDDLHISEIMTVGIKVIVEAIESNQGLCQWRAVKLLVTKNISKPENNLDPNDDAISLNLEKEKDISMTFPIIFEKVNLQQYKTLLLEITNNSSEIYIFNKWIMLSKKRDSQVSIKPLFSKPSRFYPGQTITLTITCEPKFLGKAKECLVILFRGFQLKRYIQMDVVDSNTLSLPLNCNDNHYMLKFSERLLSLKETRKTVGNSLIPGIKPCKPPAFVSQRIAAYPIPDKIWAAILGYSDKTINKDGQNFFQTAIMKTLPCLNQELNMTNYVDRWHTLLFMEEVFENIAIRVYDTPKTFLVRCQEYLAMEIKGISERRPSLIVGDRVIVRDIWDTNSQQYEGFIHIIKGDMVLFKFNQQFQDSYAGGDVSVEFHFSRTQYRRRHHAVNKCFSSFSPNVLLPRRVMIRPPQVSAENIKCVKWFNGYLNHHQKSAINNILLGECRPMPYIIFGPPGTGKTITIIETILQILTMIPESRILVATPSNSASNLITEHLVKYKDSFSGSIVRLLAHHMIESPNISNNIKPYCATLDISDEKSIKSKYEIKNGIHLRCRKSFIGRHRVTIGTNNCLGCLYQMGFPRGHFTHLIVDEAGQATEPENLLSMSFIDKENGQIILAGDPMQLGPVVLSKTCNRLGLGVSFLQRLLGCFPYNKDNDAFQNGFDNRLVTMLKDNYRSLYEVLKFPSEMFYGGALVAKIDSNMPWTSKFINATCDIFDIEDKKSGGTFVYGIRGHDTRHEDCPSWLNLQEASMVALVTCKLYKKGIVADEIGIITPYIAQIKHLRHVFDAMGLQQPKIGTVEEFQGQERPIILATIVRSTNSYIQDDVKYILGFVNCKKRFNVLFTRAMISTIIFCNPEVLSLDPIWMQLIKNAVDEGKYMGCDLPKTLSRPCDGNELYELSS